MNRRSDPPKKQNQKTIPTREDPERPSPVRDPEMHDRQKDSGNEYKQYTKR